MFLNAMRFVSVCLVINAGTSVLPAWERGEWSVVLDSIALTLLAVVIWFAVERGSEKLHPPNFGTRGLRLTLYGTILTVCFISGIGRSFGLDTWGCGNVTTVFLAAAILLPFIRFELDASRHDAVS